MSGQISFAPGETSKTVDVPVVGEMAAELDETFVLNLTNGVHGDIGDAQDIAQEAFCRAWQRWGSIVRYDNPVAWIRRVATNLQACLVEAFHPLRHNLRVVLPVRVPGVGVKGRQTHHAWFVGAE